MSGPRPRSVGRALTPAVAGAAAFAGLAAVVSILFVTARGGLEVPVAATSAPPVAIASPVVTDTPSTPSASMMPGGPSPEATQSAGPSPTTLATPGPSAAPPGPTPRPDPLAALPACPGQPGCHLYAIRRGDSYSGIADRFGVPLWIMDALNPEVTDRRVIVVGQTLYLGRDPTARLEPCPDGACHLYTVRSGDTLSTVAARFGLSVRGIAALNPTLNTAFIVTGQVIRLPLYEPA